MRADPEIDILKHDDDLANGDIEKFYDEEELGNTVVNEKEANS